MELLELTKTICQQNGIKPARTKGQNFLIEENVYDQVVAAAAIGPDDTVLEVGPGLGFLTERLARVAKRVIAVELDDKLARLLCVRLETLGIKNVEVVNEDILKFPISNFQFPNNTQYPNDQTADVLRVACCVLREYKIVANLPYNITSFFLRKFLSGADKPESMVLLLQKEVAERIVARPPDMSLLAVSVQYYATAEIIAPVSRTAFWPSPAVDSAVVRLALKGRKGDEGEKGDGDVNEGEFFRLVKFGFSAKRKMLKNNLANGYHLEPSEIEKYLISANIDPKIRAEGLSVEDWVRLYDLIKTVNPLINNG